MPEPREVELDRHPELGFGFVAGSEKPVIVRWEEDSGRGSCRGGGAGQKERINLDLKEDNS